jgi:hypothetical protein
MVAATVSAFIVAFMFLVPVVGYATPTGLVNCPANGCDFLQQGSVTYWAFGVGGTLKGPPPRYSISVAASSTGSASSTMITGYTVSAEPTRTATMFTNSTNNMQLQLSMSASSSSASGVAISVTVDEYNPLASTNNVTAANDWLLSLNGLNGAPCGDDGPTVGFAIAQGNYAASNVTAAKFLNLVNPSATYACSLYLGYGNPTGFLFQPMNDMAASHGCNQQQCMSGSASTGLTSSSWGAVTGYWSQGGTFVSFPRGTYTVVAEDEWGGLVVAHFAVS